ncbi:hypothetical protein LTR94_037596, partial [Friedmanniomyces endolithicus]
PRRERLRCRRHCPQGPAKVFRPLEPHSRQCRATPDVGSFRHRRSLDRPVAQRRSGDRLFRHPGADPGADRVGRSGVATL